MFIFFCCRSFFQLKKEFDLKLKPVKGFRRKLLQTPDAKIMLWWFSHLYVNCGAS